MAVVWPIDNAVLDEIRDLTDQDPEQFAELVGNYLESVQILMETVAEAADQGDAKAIQQATHDIKSMSAMFGAMHLSELARRIEKQTSRQDLTGIAEQTAAMQDAFDRVHAALVQEMSV